MVSTSGCSSGSATTASGEITSNTTWSGCVQLENSVDIKEGAVLTVEPGTTVTATSNGTQGIYVEAGAIKASGTSDNPVVFTSATQSSGAWGGIVFNGDTQNGPSVLQNIVVDYGGGNGWGAGNSASSVAVTSENVKLNISNAIIQNGDLFGLFINNSEADISLENTSFIGNDNAAELPPAQTGIFNATSSFADGQNVTVYNGSITDSMTWDECVPYLFKGEVQIQESALVTVSPGATLRFQSGVPIRINGGKMNAVGSEDQKITFTKESSSAGAWGGISFTSNTLSDDNVLEHVNLEGAGGTGWGAGYSPASLVVKQESVKLAVRNTAIRNGDGFGLYVNSGQADLTIENSAFEGNASGTATIPPPQMNAFSGNSTFGDDQQISVRGGTIEGEQTWHAGLPFELQGGVETTSESSITVEPGATIASTTSGSLYAQGPFNAEGTQDNPIQFKGVQEQPGSWGGLRIGGQNLSDDNILNHVTIEHGGNNGWGAGNSPANLLLSGDLKLTLKNTTLRNSSENGIFFSNEVDLTCENVTIEDSPKVAGAYDSLDAACGSN